MTEAVTVTGFGWVKRLLDFPSHIKRPTKEEPAGRMHRPITSRVTYKHGTYIAPGMFGALTFVVLATMVGVAHTASASWFSLLPATAASAPLLATTELAGNSQTLSLLRAARNIDPTPSRGGGDVTVVEGVALAAGAAAPGGVAQDQSMPATSDQIFLYMVQDGDTLSQVAKMFGVSINTIIWSNELSSSKDIHPGETLLILPVSGVQHTVVKGDTVASIAKKYNGDKDEIIAYNGLPSDGTLTAGAVVTVPGGERAEAKKSPSKPTSGAKIITGGPNVSGYFISPLPSGTYTKTQGIHGYNAVDLGAPTGTPIRAAAAGTVIVARVGGWNGGYGNYVVIDHPNGTQTLYAHQSKVIVWQGQSVVQGQVIGYVGSTGRSTGPHLHIEVRGARNPF